MTYWILNLIFLIPALAVAGAGLLRRAADRGNPEPRRTPLLAAVALATAILLALTACFDNAMIAAGLFGYAPDKISGAMLGAAPLEDFAYPLAAALLLPGLWQLLGTIPHGREPRGPAPHGREPHGRELRGRTSGREPQGREGSTHD
ncbi:MAG: lycopene cyclase domain-containing protein [Actinomycetales bacterium]|jgi:lycopene cyclase domain-containing protein